MTLLDRTHRLHDANVTIEHDLALTHTDAERGLLLEAAFRLEQIASEQSTGFAAVFLGEVAGFDDRVNAHAAVNTLTHLGLLDGPLTAALDLACPTGMKKRLLRTLELPLVRLMSTADHVNAGRIALLEAGAASAEVVAVRADQVAGDVNSGFIVDLPGTRTTAPRQLRVPAWANRSFAVLLARTNTGQLLYSGSSSDLADQTSAVQETAKRMVRRAGLAARQAVTADSIRHTGARLVYDAAPRGRGLEAAGTVLGIDNLDRVAERIDVRAEIANVSSELEWALPEL